MGADWELGLPAVAMPHRHAQKRNNPFPLFSSGSLKGFGDRLGTFGDFGGDFGGTKGPDRKTVSRRVLASWSGGARADIIRSSGEGGDSVLEGFTQLDFGTVENGYCDYLGTRAK